MFSTFNNTYNNPLNPKYIAFARYSRNTLSHIFVDFFFQWIPICRNGSLQTGLFELPVMLDPPSIDLRRLPTDQAPSGTKWVDNKKNIFSVELIPATTVHPLDNYIDPFLQLTVI